MRGAYGAAQPYVDAGAGDLSSGAQGLGAVQPYLQAGSDATAGAGGYQGLGSASFGQAGGYAGQSAAALAGMQPYMGAASGSIGSASGAFGQEQAGLGAAQGYFGQAASLATPQSFDASAVQQYMSPYLSSVVGATQANLQENDRQQAEGLTSSAIGSGAYGGDRAGVAQAELSRQQDLADGQTIAGLYNTGYSNAEGQFNAAQGQRQQGASLLAGLGSATTQNALGYGSVGQGDLASASGYNALAQDQGQQAQQFGTLGNLANATGSGYTGLASDSLGQASAYGTLGQLQGTTGQAYGTMAGIAGNLGSTEQSNLISGASAGLQGSTLGQQNQQQQDTAAYNQYMAGLSYPYQNVGFLSNIVQGIGSQEGNTQTTQGNALSSIAGLGTSAIGILGATGGFGANGYLSGLGSSVSSAFSDARVKDDIASIGTTHDGQPIYRFRYKGDPKVQMGLMAQDVEKRDPARSARPAASRRWTTIARPLAPRRWVSEHVRRSAAAARRRRSSRPRYEPGRWAHDADGVRADGARRATALRRRRPCRHRVGDPDGRHQLRRCAGRRRGRAQHVAGRPHERVDSDGARPSGPRRAAVDPRDVRARLAPARRAGVVRRQRVGGAGRRVVRERVDGRCGRVGVVGPRGGAGHLGERRPEPERMDGRALGRARHDGRHVDERPRQRRGRCVEGAADLPRSPAAGSEQRGPAG